MQNFQYIFKVVFGYKTFTCQKPLGPTRIIRVITGLWFSVRWVSIVFNHSHHNAAIFNFLLRISSNKHCCNSPWQIFYEGGSADNVCWVSRSLQMSRLLCWHDLTHGWRTWFNLTKQDSIKKQHLYHPQCNIALRVQSEIIRSNVWSWFMLCGVIFHYILLQCTLLERKESAKMQRQHFKENKITGEKPASRS